MLKKLSITALVLASGMATAKAEWTASIIDSPFDGKDTLVIAISVDELVMVTGTLAFILAFTWSMFCAIRKISAVPKTVSRTTEAADQGMLVLEKR